MTVACKRLKLIWYYFVLFLVILMSRSNLSILWLRKLRNFYSAPQIEKFRKSEFHLRNTELFPPNINRVFVVYEFFYFIFCSNKTRRSGTSASPPLQHWKYERGYTETWKRRWFILITLLLKPHCVWCDPPWNVDIDWRKV